MPEVVVFLLFERAVPIDLPGLSSDSDDYYCFTGSCFYLERDLDDLPFGAGACFGGGRMPEKGILMRVVIVDPAGARVCSGTESLATIGAGRDEESPLLWCNFEISFKLII